MSDLHIEPVAPTIGAEISGIDLRQPLDDTTVTALRDALSDHLVLFFRDQPIDVDQLHRFGGYFGAPFVHPLELDREDRPGVMAIHSDENSETVSGDTWHTDISFSQTPPLGSILHIHKTPTVGGDTMFANMYAAYAALSQPLQKFLENLTATHGSAIRFGGHFKLEADVYPEAVHPVVRSHPVTGRKVLFVNQGFTTRINELDAVESGAILAMLFDHLKSPRFQCRFKWRPDSIAFWDNRCTQHLAVWDYYPEIRSGHRYTVSDDQP